MRQSSAFLFKDAINLSFILFVIVFMKLMGDTEEFYHWNFDFMFFLVENQWMNHKKYVILRIKVIIVRINQSIFNMKEIEVFIAGSKTLAHLRDSARAALMELNNQYREYNAMFRPYTFEDFPRSFTIDGRQADYNSYISNQADYVIFIFDDGFGDVTLKELDLAIRTFQEKKRPQIYVYCNEAKMNCNKFKEIHDLINSYGQYYIAYDEGYFKSELKEDFTRVLVESLNNDDISNETVIKLFPELANNLNDLYVNSIPVYLNFPQIDKIYEMMEQPCEGEYQIEVQAFANSIHQLAFVLDKIVQNSDAFQVYKQLLQKIDSKVLHLYTDRKFLDMNKLTDVVDVLDVVQTKLQNPMMAHLIRARLATNVGKGLEYDNANIRSFFYMGNLILNEVTPNYVNNVGAAILHDLFMVLPDDCKMLVNSNFANAISDAEEIGDLYHISLGK